MTMIFLSNTTNILMTQSFYESDIEQLTLELLRDGNGHLQRWQYEL
jgi:hypothetical protein